MPDITITVTAAQAQRIATAFGTPPAGVTQQQWLIQQTKAFWKARVREVESRAASNTAFDAALTQAETDFPGF